MGKSKGSKSVDKDRMLTTQIFLIPRPNEVAELGEVLTPLFCGINEVIVQPLGPEGPRWTYNFRNTTEVVLRVFLDLKRGTILQQLEQKAMTPTRAEEMRTFLKAVEEAKDVPDGEASSTKSEPGIPSGDNEEEG